MLLHHICTAKTVDGKVTKFRDVEDKQDNFTDWPWRTVPSSEEQRAIQASQAVWWFSLSLWTAHFGLDGPNADEISSMRVHRCAGVSQQLPLLFKSNSNHFSIETIASRNRGQAQMGWCPAGEGRDRVRDWSDWGLRRNKKLTNTSRQINKNINVPGTLQFPSCWRTHTHTHQRQLQWCWGAWEGGQQSDYSPDLWTRQTSSPQRRSDPPELQSDPNPAPLRLWHTHLHTHR